MDDGDYPRWMFHRTLPIQLVQSKAEEDALDAGWARSPWPEVREPEATPPGEQSAVPQAVSQDVSRETSDPVPAKKLGWPKGKPRGPRKPWKTLVKKPGAVPRLITDGFAHSDHCRVEFTTDEWEYLGLRFHRGDVVEMRVNIAERLIKAGVARAHQDRGAA
jgi:hypothetical protein